MNLADRAARLADANPEPHDCPAVKKVQIVANLWRLWADQLSLLLA